MKIEKTNNVEMFCQNISTKKTLAFTLVELIIVITILAILATIGIMSFQSYSIDARDGKRKTDLGAIRTGLELYQIKNSKLPIPDEKLVTVHSGGINNTIALQGYAGETVQKAIRITNEVKDDNTENIYYTYTINANKTKYSLLAMLENSENLANSNLVNTTYARMNYESRYPYILGNYAVFFSGTTNSPLQTISGTGLNLSGNATQIKAIISGTGTKLFTGSELPNIIEDLTKSKRASSDNNGGGTSPTCSDGVQNGIEEGIDCGGSCKACIVAATCPTGFIHIPGSVGKSLALTTPTNGWCVAKYEMSPYSTTGWTKHATYKGWQGKTTSTTDTVLYTLSGSVTSKSGTEPVIYVSKKEAEQACSTQLVDQTNNPILGGHLLGVELWGLIARDIEKQAINWSSNQVGSGNMSRGHASGIPDYVLPGLSSDTVSNPTSYYSNRSWKLSNNEVIHDFAGNLWEWYYESHSNTGGDGNRTYYSSGSVSKSVLGYPTTPEIAYASAIIEGRSTGRGLGGTYNAGVTAYTSGTEYASIFGGRWSRTTGAGVFTSYWITLNASSSRNGTIGFRCIAPAN